GVVEGRKFTHPEFRLAFEAPSGFFLINGTRAVSINGQSGKGEFGSAAYSGSLDSYIRSVFADLTEQGQPRIEPATIQHTTVNGIPAAYGTARVASNGSQVDVVVFAYEWSGSQAFHFLTISQAGNASTFNAMFSSLRRISAAEAAQVRPRKLVVTTVQRGDTVQSLSRRMAYSDAPLDRFLALNALATDAHLAPGQKVKLVTY
ncbi:MAG: LysM peptidoglycan-binding domain-containing protein, partial [Burkholderiales bacterium]